MDHTAWLYEQRAATQSLFATGGGLVFVGDSNGRFKALDHETGDVLWQDTRAMSYSPQASSSGNPLADLLAQAVVAAIEKGMPNYIPLAQQANMLAASTVGQGLPAGPYREEAYKKDLEAFPVR